ncbi:GerAB/ArcD/ProY family transporter [Brevibacillus ginsengisoli]|uniref:GerAB/ArcD/ProY family transporter n=1 Tax=Brevibacillus ginsengisoli TaxID=363854 RepID=UPI003CF3C2FB
MKNRLTSAGYTNWQLTTMIYSTLIGVGVLTLPRTSTQILQQNGWLSPILGGLVAMLSSVAIAKLSDRFPRLTLVQFSPLIWGTDRRNNRIGKWLGLPWILFFLAYMYVITAMTSRVFGEVVVTAVLRDTPLEAIIIAMFLLAFFLCLHDLDVVARVNELLFLVILFPILLIAIASFQKADWNNLLPLSNVSWQQVLKGSLETSFSYQGYEIMLIFYAFALPGAKKVKTGLWGIGLSIMVYTLVVVAGIVVFGDEELQKVTWPTLEIVKTTKVPGLILERLESAFLGVWVAAVFTTIANFYYCFIYGLRQLLGKGIRFQRYAGFFLFIPLFYISLQPQNITELFKVMNTLGYLGLIVSLVIPSLYLLVSIIRGKSTKRPRMEETNDEV